MVISIAELCLALPNLYFRWVRDCNLKGEYATLNCTVHTVGELKDLTNRCFMM